MGRMMMVVTGIAVIVLAVVGFFGFQAYQKASGIARQIEEGDQYFSTANYKLAVKSYQAANQELMTQVGSDRLIMAQQLLKEQEAKTPPDSTTAAPADTAKAMTSAAPVKTETFKPAGSLNPHSDAVFSATFSNDGQFVLTGSKDKTAKLWSAAEGKVLQSYEGNPDAVRSADISPDGKMVAGVGYPGFIKIWDTLSGKEITHFEIANVNLNGVVFSPDNKLIAVCGSSGILKLYDIAANKETKQFAEDKKAAIRGAAFSADGKYLASADSKGNVNVWNVETGAGEIKLSAIYTKAATCVAFSPDGKLLASGSDDKTLKIIDVAAKKVKDSIESFNGEVKSVSFSPNGRYIAATGSTGLVKMWDASNSAELKSFDRGLTAKDMSIWSYTVEFNHESKLILTANHNGTAVIWDIAANQVARVLGAPATVAAN